MLKMRAGKLKISRSLADFCAAHHQPQVFGFHMLTASFNAVIHGGLQANLMAGATSIYAGLRGVFGVGWVMHGILQSEGTSVTLVRQVFD